MSSTYGRRPMAAPWAPAAQLNRKPGGKGTRHLLGDPPGVMPPAADAHKYEVKAQRIDDGTLFLHGENDANDVAANDVSQGVLGNCYLMGQIAALAAKRPDVIKNMIQDNCDGSFTVTFYGYANSSPWQWLCSERTPQKVTVDARFWLTRGRRLQYANPGDTTHTQQELWPMLIEKAWAKLHGSYGKITSDHMAADWSAAVTGQQDLMIDLPGVDEDGLATLLDQHWSSRGAPIRFETYRDQDRLAGNIAANHCYALEHYHAGRAWLHDSLGSSAMQDVNLKTMLDSFERMALVQV